MSESTLLQRARRAYYDSALVVFNTLVFLALLNGGLYAIFRAKDIWTAPASARPGQTLFRDDGSPVDNGKIRNFSLEWFDYGAYGDISEQYASEVLTSFYELSMRGFVYQPWVQFSEPVFASRLLNVVRDAKGFPQRRTVNPDNVGGLPVVSIFVLGGSSTFGFHVSDEHTLPSALSAILNKRAHEQGLRIHVEVANYGREYFTPSEEAVLLTDLLKTGHRPNLVIFMDGVNFTEDQDVPHFTEEFTNRFDRLQFSDRLRDHFEEVPMMRLASFVQRRLGGANVAATATKIDQSQRIRYIVNGFEQNRQIAEAVSGLYSAHTLFILQPNGAYNYSRDLYRHLPPWFSDRAALVAAFYEQLKAKHERVDLSWLFSAWGHKKAIVDDFHYSPQFNVFLAQHLADLVDLKALTPRAQLIDEASSTGGARRNLPRDPDEDR